MGVVSLLFDMQRYFVNIDKNGNFVFTEQDVFHITKVMRCKINDQIEVVYNNHVSVVNIDSLKPLLVHVVSNVDGDTELPTKLRLFLPLLKGDKTELIIQKATEIGVTSIVFYYSKRSIIKLDQKEFEKKLSRYTMIAKEASEQCHRNTIPEIKGIINLVDIKEYQCDNNLLAYELESGSTSSLEKALENNGSYSVILGPEGGYEKSEVDLLIANNFIPISLGKRILRVETAAIYALSVISYTMEK